MIGLLATEMSDIALVKERTVSKIDTFLQGAAAPNDRYLDPIRDSSLISLGHFGAGRAAAGCWACGVCREWHTPAPRPVALRKGGAIAFATAVTPSPSARTPGQHKAQRRPPSPIGPCRPFAPRRDGDAE